MKKGGFFSNLALKYQRFMYGRYGNDNLNRFISFFALFLCAISLFVKSSVLPFAILALLAFSFYRSFSKKHEQRRRENQAYLRASKPVKNYFKYWVVRIKSRKSHYVYTCAKCKGILRVPKSASPGKIEVKCPKCGASFARHIADADKRRIK